MRKAPQPETVGGGSGWGAGRNSQHPYARPIGLTGQGDRNRIDPMESWVWFLSGCLVGFVVAGWYAQGRISVWRASSQAWEESAKMLDDEVKELQDELRPPR